MRKTQYFMRKLDGLWVESNDLWGKLNNLWEKLNNYIIILWLFPDIVVLSHSILKESSSFIWHARNHHTRVTTSLETGRVLKAYPFRHSIQMLFVENTNFSLIWILMIKHSGIHTANNIVSSTFFRVSKNCPSNFPGHEWKLGMSNSCERWVVASAS